MTATGKVHGILTNRIGEPSSSRSRGIFTYKKIKQGKSTEIIRCSARHAHQTKNYSASDLTRLNIDGQPTWTDLHGGLSQRDCHQIDQDVAILPSSRKSKQFRGPKTQSQQNGSIFFSSKNPNQNQKVYRTSSRAQTSFRDKPYSPRRRSSSTPAQKQHYKHMQCTRCLNPVASDLCSWQHVCTTKYNTPYTGTPHFTYRDTVPRRLQQYPGAHPIDQLQYARVSIKS